jgi:hypothetical protein
MQTRMELRALITQACNEIIEDMCYCKSTTSQFMLKKLPEVMVIIFETADSQRINLHAMNGLSFCMLVSSIVSEIEILLIDQILDHFVHHPVFLNVTDTVSIE